MVIGQPEKLFRNDWRVIVRNHDFPVCSLESECANVDIVGEQVVQRLSRYAVSIDAGGELEIENSPAGIRRKFGENGVHVLYLPAKRREIAAKRNKALIKPADHMSVRFVWY